MGHRHSNLAEQGIHYDCSNGGSSGENVESRNSSTLVCLVPALLLHPVLSSTFRAPDFTYFLANLQRTSVHEESVAEQKFKG